MATCGEVKPNPEAAKPTHVPTVPTRHEFHCGVKSIQGQRNEMEDEHNALVNFHLDTGETFSMFAVYDGHSGKSASRYLRDQFPRLIIEHLKEHPPGEAVCNAVQKAEDGFRERCKLINSDSGSTLAAFLVVNKTILTVNVGDSEVLLYSGGVIHRLSEVHNMYKNPDEEERVKLCGGIVWKKRLGHPCFNPSIVSLAVTRSIGDEFFKQGNNTEDKPIGLVCTPFIVERALDDNDKFIIIACDGLFDVLSHEEVTEFVRESFDEKHDTPQTIADNLVELALDKGSSDNITVIVVSLNPCACDCADAERRFDSLCFKSKSHNNILPEESQNVTVMDDTEPFPSISTF